MAYHMCSIRVIPGSYNGDNREKASNAANNSLGSNSAESILRDTDSNLHLKCFTRKPKMLERKSLGTKHCNKRLPIVIWPTYFAISSGPKKSEHGLR